jgi:hypothetical protein
VPRAYELLNPALMGDWMVNRRRALLGVGQCTRVCYGMNKQVVRPAIDDHVWVVCVRDEGDGSGKLSC